MKHILTAILIMAVSLVFAVGAWAAVTTTGNVEPADPTTWTGSTDVYVGDSAAGAMEVNDGTAITSDDSYIADDAGVTGVVTVTGSGSTWTHDRLRVGDEGIGTLNILSGGNVTNGISTLGDESTGSGTVTVTGSGSTWTNDYLTIGDYGTGTLNILNGGNVTSDGVDMGANYTGVGTVTVDGAGSQWITDTSGSSWLYVGDYGDGTLTISNGGIVNSATSIIGNYDGSGAVIVTGSGSQWTNSSELVVAYEGGTGDLTIADGGVVSSADSFIGDDGGIGTVTVTGTGSTWTISGELLVGDYDYDGSGTLNISSGAEVIGVDAVINSMSTLSGDSRLTLNSGNGILTNYGIIAPGNSIGTLTVDGDVVFENGSMFEVEIDNAGNSDKLDVSGDVTINGGSTLTINSNGETITDNKQYTLIEAGGSIAGTFDTVDTALVTWDTGVTGSMSYPGSTALLVVGTPSVTPFDDLSLLQTDNQRACGQAVEQISDDGGNLGGITAALQGIVGDDNLRDAYDQLSGQTRPSIAPIVDAVVSNFASTVLDRMHKPQTATSNQYYPDSKYYFWITGFGVNGDRDSKDGVNGSDYDTGGVATGLDHQVTENFRVGITLGLSDTDVDYDNTRDNSNVDSIYGGLYASYEYLHGYIDGIFIYADLDSKTNRYVDFIGEKNKGDFDGYEVLTSIEAARNYTFKDILVQPLLGFEYSYQHQDKYTETGGSSSLHYDDQSFESYKGFLGVKGSKYFYKNDRQSFWGQLQTKWAHEFGDTSADIKVSFASEPDYRFSIKDAKMNRDSAIFNTGLRYEPNKNTVFFVDYDAQVNNDTVVHMISGGIQLAF